MFMHCIYICIYINLHRITIPRTTPPASTPKWSPHSHMGDHIGPICFPSKAHGCPGRVITLQTRYEYDVIRQKSLHYAAKRNITWHYITSYVTPICSRCKSMICVYLEMKRINLLRSVSWKCKQSVQTLQQNGTNSQADKHTNTFTQIHTDNR